MDKKECCLAGEGGLGGEAQKKGHARSMGQDEAVHAASGKPLVVPFGSPRLVQRREDEVERGALTVLLPGSDGSG